MPNRILHEGIRNSERIASLDAGDRWLFVCLLTAADDFGRYHANPALVGGHCLPFDGHSRAVVGQMLDRLVHAGLITMYIADGRRYLQIQQWRQRTRAEKSKYPEPQDVVTIDGQLYDECQTSAHGDGDGDGDVSIVQPVPSGTNYTMEFERFWQSYPKRLQKGQAFKAFQRAKKRGAVDVIIAGITTSPATTRDDPQFIPYAATWLNGNGWEDEPAPAARAEQDQGMQFKNG